MVGAMVSEGITRNVQEFVLPDKSTISMVITWFAVTAVPIDGVCEIDAMPQFSTMDTTPL